MSSTEHDVAARPRDDQLPDDDRHDASASERSGSVRTARTETVTSNGDGSSDPSQRSHDEVPTEPVPVVPSSARSADRNRAERGDDRQGMVTSDRESEPSSNGQVPGQVRGDPLMAKPPVARDEPPPVTRAPDPVEPDPVEPEPAVTEPAVIEPIEEYPGGRPELDDRSTPTKRPVLGRRATIIDAERHLVAPVQRVMGRRPRVRKVTRVVRHVDPWTVFKVAAVFSLVIYGVLLTAGVLLWNVAHTTGTIENVERFMESFGWETFEFDGGQIYRAAWVSGLFGAIGLTGLAVLGATLFNLITDLVGGVRFTVLEEEVVEKTTSPMKRFTVRHTDDTSETPRPPDPTQPTNGENASAS